MKGEAVMGRDDPAVSGRDRETWRWRRGGDGGEASGGLEGSRGENEPRGAFHPNV